MLFKWRKKIAELEKTINQLQKEIHSRDKALRDKEKWNEFESRVKFYKPNKELGKKMLLDSTKTRNKWKRIPSPFTSYQIRKDKKVRNIKTKHELKPTRGNNGALYYTLNKDDGSKASVKLNTLLEITYGNKKYKSRKKHYKPGQIALPF